MKVSESLMKFQDEHVRFLELFVAHQCALMALNLERARLALDLVVYELGVHADVEDEVLMPIFVERAGPIEGGRPEMFQAEHDKLARLLDELSSRLGALETARLVEPRQALELIEMGFTFKHLFDHHTKRENAVFYPALDDLIQEPEGREGLARVWVRIDDADAAARERRGDPPRPFRVGST